MRTSSPQIPNGPRRGSTLLEFVLAGSFIFIPLVTGLSTVGMSMLMSNQVVALNRTAGHMFSMGVDFSQTANRNLLIAVAGNLNITSAGGNGVVILTEIEGTGNNQAVCERRLVIGNASLRASSFVNPSSAVLDSAGNVTNLNDASANADSLSSWMPISQGQVVYLAETYFSTANFDWTGFLTGTGIYDKAIF
jgi:hypothetical protein